jgi:regulatory protein
MRQRPVQDPADHNAIEQRAVFLLGRREHSAAELTRKLTQKGFDKDAVDMVIEQLQARQWQSDERFAAGYIRQRIDAAYGPLKIRADLSQKGVSQALVEDLLAAADVDWVALAVQRHQRRFGSEPPADDKEKARRQRHLYGRGFLPDQVRQACQLAIS